MNCVKQHDIDAYEGHIEHVVNMLHTGPNRTPLTALDAAINYMDGKDAGYKGVRTLLDRARRLTAEVTQDEDVKCTYVGCLTHHKTEYKGPIVQISGDFDQISMDLTTLTTPQHHSPFILSVVRPSKFAGVCGALFPPEYCDSVQTNCQVLGVTYTGSMDLMVRVSKWLDSSTPCMSCLRPDFKTAELKKFGFKDGCKWVSSYCDMKQKWRVWALSFVKKWETCNWANQSVEGLQTHGWDTWAPFVSVRHTPGDAPDGLLYFLYCCEIMYRYKVYSANGGANVRTVADETDVAEVAKIVTVGKDAQTSLKAVFDFFLFVSCHSFSYYNYHITIIISLLSIQSNQYIWVNPVFSVSLSYCYYNYPPGIRQVPERQRHHLGFVEAVPSP